MRTRDHLHTLKKSFALDQARSWLTLLGIVVGTGSIVMLAGLLRGAEEALLRMNQGISESDTVIIDSDEAPPKQLGKAHRELSRLDGIVLGESPQLSAMTVESVATREVTAHRSGRSKRARLIGAAPTSRALYRLGVEHGRFIDDDDMRSGKRVAVIGYEIWAVLLEKNPKVVGSQLTVDSETFTIAGVLTHKPTMGHGDGTWMWDRRILVPQTAFDATFEPQHRIRSIVMRKKETALGTLSLDNLGKVAEQIVLRRHLGVRNFKLRDRSGQNQERLIIGVIQVLLLGTGLMSLFIGGINIMNIMLVTVAERTKEIGIRRAVGASPRAILIQFIGEAATVSLAGGLFGVAGGVVLSWLIALGLRGAFGAWSFHVELWSIALGLFLALVTGVMFGLFPAWRASRSSPVEALRC